MERRKTTGADLIAQAETDGYKRCPDKERDEVCHREKVKKTSQRISK